MYLYLYYKDTHALSNYTTLSQNICFDLFLEDSKGRICTTTPSFFLCCKN